MDFNTWLFQDFASIRTPEQIAQDELVADLALAPRTGSMKKTFTTEDYASYVAGYDRGTRAYGIDAYCDARYGTAISTAATTDRLRMCGTVAYDSARNETPELNYASYLQGYTRGYSQARTEARNGR